MSVNKVDQFLKESGGNNFTETAPRPPVPGEENETKSNGGMSTQSSGSHKSQVSHSSSRSHCSKQGDTNPATPRKSNLDKTLSCSVEGCEEMDAPLGFEPEGSAANSPPFTENSTPPYLKWAENMNYLLEDWDGINLFRTFLDQEGTGRYSLEFWLACKGLKIKDKKDSEAIQVIKVIQKKYIKSDKLPYLKANTKHAIYEKLKSGLDVMIFDEAQAEVEEFMRNNLYTLFIKSDLYVSYVQKGGDSPKSSNSSSGSNSARPMSGPLPPLVEDIELQPDDINSSFSIGPPVSKSRSRSHSSEKKQEFYEFSAPYPPYQQRSVPYHVSYAPTSAQDSEIQSLSSQDNLTDDTRSLTDSSVDGHSFRESKRSRKYYKTLQRQRLNPDLGSFIPRTDRAPKDRNIAEVDPKKFAEMLIERLERILKEQEKTERVHKVIHESEMNDTMDRSCISATSSRNTTSLVPLLTSSLIDEHENADSILEEHCSRVWERSAQQTPSRSPGRHSPPARSKSPERTRKVLSQTQPHSGASSMPGTLHMKPLHNKKRTDFFSMSSFDSGVGEDKNCALETHKHIHHHHHHHHGRDRKSKHKLEIEAQQHSMVCWGDVGGTPRPHSSGGTGRKTGPRNANHSSDAASNFDSGISLPDSISQPPHPATNDTSTTKVLKWMMDNESANRGVSATYPDSDKTSSSHNRRSHKTTALAPQVPPQQFKQSMSKKCSNSSSSHGNRSASAESSYRTGWGTQDVAGPGLLPSQPFVQDPSMPPLPLPNTTVQLEEVHRRLEAQDQTKAAPVKSKSFTGGLSKDKRVGMPLFQGSNQMFAQGMSTTKTVPADLDLSSETRSDKKTSKKSSGSGNTSTSSRPDETVIGYYLFNEPIPYRTTHPQPTVTLGQLKQLIGKKGNFRYFFKTHTDNNDFDSDVVWEEIKEDSCILPLFEGKVVAKVEKID